MDNYLVVVSSHYFEVKSNTPQEAYESIVQFLDYAEVCLPFKVYELGSPVLKGKV